MVQTAEVRFESDSTFPQDWPCQRRIFVQRQVRAGAVVVVGISPEHVAQMSHVENNKMVQALSSDRSDQALDVTVLPRRPRGRGAISDTHCSDPSLEYLSVDAVAVSDEVFGRRVPRKGLRDLAGDPISRRIGGDRDMNQPTPVMAQDDEAEQQFEGRGGNHEDIDRGNAVGVVSQKGLPRL